MQTDRNLENEWLNADEVGELLGVSARMVRRWTDDDQLACIKTPGGQRRFLRRDVDAFIESRGKSGLAEPTVRD